MDKVHKPITTQYFKSSSKPFGIYQFWGMLFIIFRDIVQFWAWCLRFILQHTVSKLFPLLTPCETPSVTLENNVWALCIFSFWAFCTVPFQAQFKFCPTYLHKRNNFCLNFYLTLLFSEIDTVTDGNTYQTVHYLQPCTYVSLISAG
jgi:hypothetical protein